MVRLAVLGSSFGLALQTRPPPKKNKSRPGLLHLLEINSPKNPAALQRRKSPASKLQPSCNKRTLWQEPVNTLLNPTQLPTQPSGTVWIICVP